MKSLNLQFKNQITFGFFILFSFLFLWSHFSYAESTLQNNKTSKTKDQPLLIDFDSQTFNEFLLDFENLNDLKNINYDELIANPEIIEARKHFIQFIKSAPFNDFTRWLAYATPPSKNSTHQRQEFYTAKQKHFLKSLFEQFAIDYLASLSPDITSENIKLAEKTIFFLYLISQTDSKSPLGLIPNANTLFLTTFANAILSKFNYHSMYEIYEIDFSQAAKNSLHLLMNQLTTSTHFTLQDRRDELGGYRFSNKPFLFIFKKGALVFEFEMIFWTQKKNTFTGNPQKIEITHSSSFINPVYSHATASAFWTAAKNTKSLIFSDAQILEFNTDLSQSLKQLTHWTQY